MTTSNLNLKIVNVEAKPREKKEPKKVLFELPVGGLSEVSGTLGGGKTEALLRFLAQRPNERIAWIEGAGRGFTLYPAALPQRGVSLTQTCFVDVRGASARDIGWVAEQTISSQAFSTVVLAIGSLGLVELRRLQLAAERAQVRVVLLNEKPSTAALWPIRFQVQVQRAPFTGELEARVLRSRDSAMAMNPDLMLARIEEIRRKTRRSSLEFKEEEGDHLAPLPSGSGFEKEREECREVQKSASHAC